MLMEVGRAQCLTNKAEASPTKRASLSLLLQEIMGGFGVTAPMLQ